MNVINGKGTLDKCPVCGSKEITISEYDGDSHNLWYEAECIECNTTWEEIFHNPEWLLTYNGKTGEEID